MFGLFGKSDQQIVNLIKEWYKHNGYDWKNAIKNEVLDDLKLAVIEREENTRKMVESARKILAEAEFAKQAALDAETRANSILNSIGTMISRMDKQATDLVNLTATAKKLIEATDTKPVALNKADITKKVDALKKKARRK